MCVRMYSEVRLEVSNCSLFLAFIFCFHFFRSRFRHSYVKATCHTFLTHSALDCQCNCHTTNAVTYAKMFLFAICYKCSCCCCGCEWFYGIAKSSKTTAIGSAATAASDVPNCCHRCCCQSCQIYSILMCVCICATCSLYILISAPLLLLATLVSYDFVSLPFVCFLTLRWLFLLWCLCSCCCWHGAAIKHNIRLRVVPALSFFLANKAMALRSNVLSPFTCNNANANDVVIAIKLTLVTYEYMPLQPTDYTHNGTVKI